MTTFLNRVELFASLEVQIHLDMATRLKRKRIETAAVVSLSSSLCSSAREDQKHTPTTDSYETDGRKKKLADMQSSIAILYVQDRMAKA